MAERFGFYEIAEVNKETMECSLKGCTKTKKGVPDVRSIVGRQGDLQSGEGQHQGSGGGADHKPGGKI